MHPKASMVTKKLLRRAYFASSLLPERNAPVVRVGDSRTGYEERATQFNWKHIWWLINQVSSSDLVEIDNDTYDICRGNISSKIMSAAVDNTKTQFHLDGTLGWGTVPGDANLYVIRRLEEIEPPYIPRRVCACYWGTNMLLSHYWTTKVRTEKKQSWPNQPRYC